MKDINWFVARMTSNAVFENLEQLLERGADPMTCAGRMREGQVAKRADLLEEAGVSREILYRLSGKKIPMNPLERMGDNPSEEETRQALKTSGKKAVIKFAVKMYDSGVGIRLIHECGGARSVGEHIPEFLKRGISPDILVRLSDYKSLKKYQRELLEAGADKDELSRKIFLRSEVMLSPELARVLGCEKVGAAYVLLGQMDGDVVDDMFDDLVEVGYSPRDLARKLSSAALADRVMQLLDQGVDPDWLATKLEPVDLLACSIPLEAYGGRKINRERVADQIRAQASMVGAGSEDWDQVTIPDFDLEVDVFDPVMGEDF